MPAPRGYPDEASACAAFAEAMNCGDPEGLLANLDPDVKIISKYRCVYGWRGVTVYLEDLILAEREPGRTAFTGVLLSRGGQVPCAYDLESIGRPSQAVTFTLSAAGAIKQIFFYPGHYLVHRDGKLADVLDGLL